MAEQVLSGRYRVVRHIARGGMAEVYLAEDQLLSRTVALKVLFPELAQDEAFVERFRREARAAASLNHHNIVSVYDFGEDDGSWFIVMEYVEGPTLRDIIRGEGPLEPARAAAIGAEVAAALAAAHAEGIVHRDVKPANVLIAESSGTVKVTDFGIARAASALQSLTMPGTVLGTATYLSPEQAQGAEVDRRTDIYSLGMVLYEMLTGKPPFTGESPVAVAYQHLKEQAPPPSTHNPQVPPALDAVVMKAMAKSPADRQPSAEELRAELLDLDRAIGDPDATMAVAAPATAMAATAVAEPSTAVLPPPPEEPPVERRPSAAYAADDGERRRRTAILVFVALLVLGLLAALALTRDDDPQEQVTVPNVVGQSVADASRQLEGAGLRAQVRERDSDGDAGKVVDQDPDAGKLADRNSDVTLFVPEAATTTTARRATTTTAASQATTTATAAPTTTQAPATTAAPTTTQRPPPTTSIVVPTTVVIPTTARP